MDQLMYMSFLKKNVIYQREKREKENIENLKICFILTMTRVMVFLCD